VFKSGIKFVLWNFCFSWLCRNDGIHAYQIEDIKRTLFSTAPIGELKPNKAGWTTEFLDWLDPSLQPIKRTFTPCEGWDFARGKGKVQAPLIGGCMEVLELIKGTIV